MRDKTATHNFSIQSELAMKDLRDHPGKLGLRGKRRLATLDPAPRLELRLLIHAFALRGAAYVEGNSCTMLHARAGSVWPTLGVSFFP